jgi:pteridine reductase
LPYALITGSAKRIGRNIALFLAKNGWDVIIHYNSSENEALKLQKAITLLGRKCVLCKNDFSKNKIYNLFEQGFSIELIINNASIFEMDSLHDLDQENFISTMKINFIAPSLIIKTILDISVFDNQINIINILDSIIYKLPKKFTSYYFSKRMLADFTRLSAKIYAPKARVNGIALGQIMKNDNQSEENFQKTFCSNPLGHSGTVEEICNTIHFIVENKSITGQIISLDGGAHLDNVNYP